MIENPRDSSSDDKGLLRRFAAFVPNWTKDVKSSSVNKSSQLSDKSENNDSPSTTISGVIPQDVNLYESQDPNLHVDFQMHNHDIEGQQTNDFDHLNFMSMDFEPAGQSGGFLLSPTDNDELASLWSYICGNLTDV